jgi:TRAP-type C4-dicarboxylate transport system permease small subunit
MMFALKLLGWIVSISVIFGVICSMILMRYGYHDNDEWDGR